MNRGHAQEAAQALTSILWNAQIKHAFIGGFAVQSLGHDRSTLDIDVEVDVGNITEIRGRIFQLLTEQDTRFSLLNLKICFTPADSHIRIPIEMLPVGLLGLPLRLNTIEVGGIPVLVPGVLILTKIKRCANLIESTRPQSCIKFRADLSDIEFLMEWLKNHRQKIDFAGYYCPTSEERLYSTTKELVNYWKTRGQGNMVELMGSLLDQDDYDKVMMNLAPQ